MGRLDGKVAMITGAGRALGRSHALEFAREGSDLLLLDICKDPDAYPYAMSTRQQLEQTAIECAREGIRVATAVADVREQQQMDAAVRKGIDEFGQIDVLVNNAGLLGPGGKPAHQLSEAEWMLVMDVNLNGAWRCSKAVLPHMMSRRSGCIINIASTGGLVGFEMFASYVASKHGLLGLTKALALEYGRCNIRVNALCPSTLRHDAELETESTVAVAASVGSALGDYEAASKALHPLGTLVTARDVAAASVWLASDDAVHVTGTAIPIDAGFVIR